MPLPPGGRRSSRRAFCPICGSTIGAIDDAPMVALALGRFDTPGRKGFAPLSHSYVTQRPRWWHVTVSDTPQVGATG